MYDGMSGGEEEHWDIHFLTLGVYWREVAERVILSAFRQRCGGFLHAANYLGEFTRSSGPIYIFLQEVFVFKSLQVDGADGQQVTSTAQTLMTTWVEGSRRGKRLKAAMEYIVEKYFLL